MAPLPLHYTLQYYCQYFTIHYQMSIMLVITLVLSTAICILAIPFYFLKPGKTRIWYNLIIGLFFEYLQSGTGILNAMTLSLINYVIIRTFKKRGFPVMFFSISYIVANAFLELHGLLQFNLIGALMYKAAVCSALAFTLDDGERNKEELTASQIERRTLKIPSFLQYISFNYFFPCVFSGPYIDYCEFEMLMYKTGEMKNTKFLEQLYEALKCYVLSFFFFFFDRSLDFPAYYLVTEEYGNSNFLYKIVYFWMVLFLQRVRFYSDWKLQNAAIALTGLSYNGVDPVTKERKFDRINQIEIMNFEVNSRNLNDKMRTWNIQVHKWILRYSYQRCFTKHEMKTSKTKLIIASIYSFLVCTLWHGKNGIIINQMNLISNAQLTLFLQPGFKTGYFMFYIQGCFMGLICKIGDKLKQKRMDIYNRIIYYITEPGKRIIQQLNVNFYISFFGSSWILGDWNRTMAFSRNFNHLIHITNILLLMLFLALDKITVQQEKQMLTPKNIAINLDDKFEEEEQDQYCDKKKLIDV